LSAEGTLQSFGTALGSRSSFQTFGGSTERGMRFIYLRLRTLTHSTRQDSGAPQLLVGHGRLGLDMTLMVFDRYGLNPRALSLPDYAFHILEVLKREKTDAEARI
jgi:hypothetical protein